LRGKFFDHNHSLFEAVLNVRKMKKKKMGKKDMGHVAFGIRSVTGDFRPGLWQ